MLYWYLYAKAMLENEEGQDLIEYVLIAGLIALVAVVAITTAGTEVNRVWQSIGTQLKTIK
jgi:pilus assembly protein Flp/PilA